jgi:hypothetical protein
VGAPAAGYYRWNGHVADRANNRRLIRRGVGGGVSVDSISIAIDGALPNITGIGFQTGTYVGAQPATYSFSANDDLELRDGQVTLGYGGLAAPLVYPYSTAAYSTPAFGAPFDGTIVNVLNSQSLTLSYYIVRFDWTTAAAFVPGAAPSGNVAGFASSGIQTNIVANVRDIAFQQAAVPIGPTPILVTQITDRVAAPGYGVMIDWRVLGKGGGTITIRDAAASAVSTPFCDRVDIYEVVEAGGDAIAAGMLVNDPLIGDDAGDGIRFRATVAGAPVLTDNGFQRFFTYTQALPALPPGVPAASGFFTAACVKSGSALFSPIL